MIMASYFHHISIIFPSYFYHFPSIFPSSLATVFVQVMMKVLSHRYDIITTGVLGQLAQTWTLAHQVHYAAQLWHFGIGIEHMGVSIGGYSQ